MGTKILKKLARLQKELKVPKDLKNDFGGFNYRSAEGICKAVKPLLDAEGLVLTLSDEVVQSGNRTYIKAVAELFDIESGESIKTEAFAREQETKKKMDESQVTGAVSSYARKYALSGMFLLDDAKDPHSNEYYREAARAELTITYEQAEALHRYMKANNINIKGWLSYHGKTRLRELTPQEYDRAIVEIEQKQYRRR